MIRSIVIVILGTILFSCKSEKQADLERFFSYVKPNCPVKISDVPTGNLEYLSINYPSTMPYSGYSSIIFIEEDSDVDNPTEKVSLTRMINLKDSCLIFIGEVITKSARCSELIPVPSLKEFNNLSTLGVDAVSKGFVERFGFEEMLDVNVDEKELGLIAKYEHGYSKGYFHTSDKKIINWIIFW